MKMKNLFYCVILAIFAVAWSANLHRNGHDVQIRPKRSPFDPNSLFQSKKDAKKKDDKKKNKGKKPSVTVPTTPYASPSKSPINPGNVVSTAGMCRRYRNLIAYIVF